MWDPERYTATSWSNEVCSTCWWEVDCWPCVKPEESTINNEAIVIKEQIVRKHASVNDWKDGVYVFSVCACVYELHSPSMSIDLIGMVADWRELIWTFWRLLDACLRSSSEPVPVCQNKQGFNRQDSWEAGHFGGCESCHFRANFKSAT